MAALRETSLKIRLVKANPGGFTQLLPSDPLHFQNLVVSESFFLNTRNVTLESVHFLFFQTQMKFAIVLFAWTQTCLCGLFVIDFPLDGLVAGHNGFDDLGLEFGLRIIKDGLMILMKKGLWIDKLSFSIKKLSLFIGDHFFMVVQSSRR